MDTKVIQASARRIIELAKQLPAGAQRDFIAEAAVILKLTEAAEPPRLYGEYDVTGAAVLPKP